MRAVTTRYLPDFAVVQGHLLERPSVCVDEHGVVVSDTADATPHPLPGKLLLPGFVNAHSHAFQRVLRGRTEQRGEGHEQDDFWSWRERMYQAATTLTPEQLFAVSRQAFLEMALAGVTTVGEFHYLQHQPDGTPYEDEALLAKVVIQAAREVGLRVVLLRVAYARAGFEVAENPRQRRFIDVDLEAFVRRVEALKASNSDPLVSVGIAPHSVRAVPRGWLEQLPKVFPTGPLHIHVAEQPAEVKASLHEHGRRPVELLAEVGLLSARTTAVHAIHLDEHEVTLLAAAHALVCACPSTERNLGDGVVRADELRSVGIDVSLGSDSQAHIDLLDEARQLEGHLRLLRLGRAVLVPRTPTSSRASALGLELLASLTTSGARSLGVKTGTLAVGEPADFVTLDLSHPSIASVPTPSLVTAAMMAASSAAIRDVAVAGRLIVKGGVHPGFGTSAQAFAEVMRALL